MNVSNDVSPLRPLLFGALIGLIVGLIIGLTWAWVIKPATYAGGAQPHELSDEFQRAYVGAVAEAYLTNRDANLASTRLRTFSVEDKVRLLSAVATDFTNRGLPNQADEVGDLAQNLQIQEVWSAEEVSTGLAAGGATDAFAAKLGQTSQAAPPGQQPLPEAASRGAGGFLRTLLWILLVLLVIAIGVLLLLRLRPRRDTAVAPSAAELAWDGFGPQPLRQWVGTYTFGQDTYDESFTIETAENDFLGECGMGILEGFASGSPKRVLAFDVWLFDKTDIRTVSMPVMSEYAYNDEILRGKLSPDATPVLAVEGHTFEIETTALLVKAKIEEVAYGEEQPPNSYFSTLEISLTAHLKPDIDVSGDMPVPEEFG